MQWKTSISKIKGDETYIRNKNILDLALDNTFAGNIYFILTGKEITPQIDKILNILFSLSIEHGVGVVSTLGARIATSAGVPLQQSIIAALSNMGHLHGGATEDAANWIQKCVEENKSPQAAVSELLQAKKKVPGYGHKILKHDKRAELLFKQAKDLDIFGKYSEFATQAAIELKKQIPAKDLPLNIDGAIAAIGLDIDLSPKTVTGLFIVGRLPGLIAHISEEREQDNGLRRLSEDEVEYLD